MRRLAIVVLVLVAASGCRALLGIDDPAVVDAQPPVVNDARDDPPGDGLQNACPASYTMTLSQNTSRYRLVTVTEDWVGAANTCADDLNTIGPVFTHLAVADDSAETEGLFGLAGRTVWIGHHDRRAEGIFETVSAQTTASFPPAPGLSPWVPGEPNNEAGNQDCVRIRGPADLPANTIDDENCAIPFAYICECDQFPDQPTKY